MQIIEHSVEDDYRKLMLEDSASDRSYKRLPKILPVVSQPISWKAMVAATGIAERTLRQDIARHPILQEAFNKSRDVKYARSQHSSGGSSQGDSHA